MILEAFQYNLLFLNKLFDKIPEDYFEINEEWTPIAEDWAFMVPLSELAQKPVHIKDVLYFYQSEKSGFDKVVDFRETIIKKILINQVLKVK